MVNKDKNMCKCLWTRYQRELVGKTGRSMQPPLATVGKSAPDTQISALPGSVASRSSSPGQASKATHAGSTLEVCYCVFPDLFSLRPSRHCLRVVNHLSLREVCCSPLRALLRGLLLLQEAAALLDAGFTLTLFVFFCLKYLKIDDFKPSALVCQCILMMPAYFSRGPLASQNTCHVRHVA